MSPKICYVANSRSVHAQRWAKYLRCRGYQVAIIDEALPYQGARPQVSDIADVSLYGANLGTRLPVPKLRGLANWIGWPLAVRQLTRALGCDILHALYVTHRGWVAVASGFHPVIVTAMGSDINLAPKQSVFYRWLTRYTLRHSDVLTGDSAALCQSMVDLGADENRTHLIQWGVDLDLFRPGLDTMPLRRRLKLNGGPVIFSPRACTPIYNIDVLIRAIPTVLQKLRDAQFILRDYNSEPQYLAGMKRLVEELGVATAVRFLGEIDYAEMPLYYNLADVCVSIASHDSNPVSVLEAMACGAALVVSNETGDEWITPGENGCVISPDAPGELASALVELLQSDDQRGKFRRSGLARIRRDGDERVWMDRLEKLYRGLFA